MTSTSARGQVDPAEDQLRSYFAAIESEAPAPAPADWAARARTEVTGARHRHWLAAAAAVVALAVATGAGVWVRAGQPTSTRPDGLSAVDGLLQQTDTTVLRLNGVEVTVPTSMIPTGDCDPPTVAIVWNPSTAVRRICQASKAERDAGSVVIVRLAEPGDARRANNEMRYGDGRYTRSVYVDHGGVIVNITSPSKAFIRRIAGTVRVPSVTGQDNPTDTTAAPTDERSALEAWLETSGPWRDDLNVRPGGRVFCGVTVVGSAPSTLARALPDDRALYAMTQCGQYYDEDGELAEGSGISIPFVFYVSGHGRHTTVVNGAWPRQQSIDADMARLFPPKVADQLNRRVGSSAAGLRVESAARAALAAGTLPPLEATNPGISTSSLVGVISLGEAVGYDGYITTEPVLETVFVPLHRCDAPVGADDELARRFRADDGTVLGAQRVLRAADEEAATNVAAHLTQGIQACNQRTDGEPATVLERTTLRLPENLPDGVQGDVFRYLLDQPGRGHEVSYVVVLRRGRTVTELVLTRPEAKASTMRPDLAALAAATALES